MDSPRSGLRRQARPPRPRVKICGLTRNVDALAAQEAGADYLGIVLSPGFGRSVSRHAAPSVVVDISVPTVAVLVDEPPASAADAAGAIGASVLQLHGHEGRGVVQELRRLGDWRLWKAVRARSVDDLHRAVDELGSEVEGFVVEGWRQGVAGGGGVELSLESDAVRAAIPVEIEFILAGGLEPGSLGEAVARFSPDVVDVSSGVEREVGRKDHEKVRAFVRAASGASTPGS